MSDAPAWSIAVMCFNEEALLEPMVQRTLAVMRGTGESFELLIVDDGSTDRSGAIADALAAAHPEVRVCHHPSNLGIGHVLLDGYRQTRGRVAMILPADLQFAPEDLPAAMEAARNADVLNICRPQRRDPWGRKLVSWVDERLVRLLFGLRVRDLHWVKLYRRELLDLLLPAVISRTPMVDTELLVRAHRRGARIVELALPHHPRTAGRSTGATWSRIARTLVDLVRLRLRLGRST